jgi:hypothetical protein
MFNRAELVTKFLIVGRSDCPGLDGHCVLLGLDGSSKVARVEPMSARAALIGSDSRPFPPAEQQTQHGMPNRLAKGYRASTSLG